MKYIRNLSTNPYYNLALEEYVLTNFRDDDYLLLWQNDKTIVVGKYQNTIEEINREEAEARSVTVVRRNTGGGAVYHDLGNLNFSYISDWAKESDLDYDRFIGPVIEALKKYGVEAEKRGRNDIVAGDRKISGNAQCIKNGRILHHGTLLVNSDMDMLQRVLNVSIDKIQSKGIKSVRSRVANISELVSGGLAIDSFVESLLDAFFVGGVVNERLLSDRELAEIKALAANKYEKWEWNYGTSPAFDFTNAVRFPSGKIQVNLKISDGVITHCSIFGDFLGVTGIEPVEEALVGKRFEKADIREALFGFDLPFYFGITLDELMECFL